METAWPTELNLSNLSPRSRARTASASAAAWARARAATPAAGSRARSRARARTRCAPASRAARCRSHMRVGKLRGTTSKDAMPIGPFRTYTQPVNVRDLEALRGRRGGHPRDAEGAGPDPLDPQRREAARRRRADEDADRHAHGVSATAREKIEAAGGTLDAAHGAEAEEAVEEAKAKPAPEAEPRPRPRPASRGRARRTSAADEQPAAERGVTLALLARQRLARPGASAPGPLHRDDPRDLPPRLVGAGAGRRLGRDRELLQRPGRHRPRPAEPLLAAARSRASRSSRSGSCRTSRPRSSSS